MRVIFINTWSSRLVKCHILRFWTSSAAQDHITHQVCNDLLCSLHMNHKLSHTKSGRTSFTTVCLSFLSWDSLVRHIVTKRALIYVGVLENPCLYHYCITSFFFYMTIQVNEAEAQKEESWLTHQKMYKAYQDVEKKAREMQSKLRNTIQKAR